MSESDWLVLIILFVGVPLAVWAGVRMLRDRS
ncbi:hypothetical protein SAMN05216561_104285 [Nocardioides psychrotolerans]|uniref:Uncharacterized protein n=1 Tax=Nocardioides psychrotolerans TaxID=1005945 RepID=A0A1I3FAH0_9ACTN|nr:hypothetical protein SAMN05216561_104285 [Nocardioides psychrotolerans]